MKVEVELYGGLRARAGQKLCSVEVPEGATIADMILALEEQFPALQGMMRTVATAVDDEIVSPDFVLSPATSPRKVALLPPVSGGNTDNTGAGDEQSTPWLSPTPLDLDQLLAETADPRCGGLVIFSGDIRNHNEGRTDVVAMEYEAHLSMASRVLSQIEKEVLERFEVHQCRIQHRIGRVELGQSSVLVVCRAPHRDGAFKGARYAIDELKERAPIWKHELYADGQSRYLDGTPLRTKPNH